MEIPAGTPLICVEADIPSQCIIGKTYIVVEVLGFSTHFPGDQIIKLSNGVITYLSRFSIVREINQASEMSKDV